MKRKLAEIISLTLSTLVLLGIFGYLAYEGFTRKPKDFLEVETRVLKEQIRKEGQYFVLPIEVANQGDRTPSMMTFTVTSSLTEKKVERSFEIQYLMRRDKRTVYILFEDDPSEASIEVHPTSYQF